MDGACKMRASTSCPALSHPAGQLVCVFFIFSQETAMKWDTPSYVEMRFGFEITMYIANR
jgi:coenzyme PQQ precursor peptide PqqA